MMCTVLRMAEALTSPYQGPGIEAVRLRFMLEIVKRESDRSTGSEEDHCREMHPKV